MCLAPAATKEDGELVSKLFGAIGKVWRSEEKLFDAVTGVRYATLFLVQKIVFTLQGYCIQKCRSPGALVLVEKHALLPFSFFWRISVVLI